MSVPVNASESGLVNPAYLPDAFEVEEKPDGAVDVVMKGEKGKRPRPDERIAILAFEGPVER